MSDAANILHKEMLRRVPKDTGNLAENITSKVLRRGLRAEVGFRGKRAKRDGFYARFIEFGTKGYSGSNVTRANSALPGGSQTVQRSSENKTDGSSWFGKYPDIPRRPARPFIGPTWEAKKPEVTSRVVKAINDAVTEAQK